MIVSLDSKSKKVRQWYRNHVYCMYDYRILFDQQKKTTDPQEKKQLEAKLRHPRKEANEHFDYGVELKIPKDEIRKFNLAIIEGVKQKKTPKTIIQELIKENGQK